MRKALTLLFLVVAALLLTSSLWASGGQEQKTGAPKKASVWLKKTFNPDANKMIEARVAEWGEKNDVNLSIEVIPTKSMVQKFNTAVEAKALPDVNFLTAAMATSFGEKGLLAQVDDLVAEIEKVNGKIAEKQKISVTIDGKLYGIPQWQGAAVLYYRKDLFSDAGIANPPDTWEELKNQAIKLSQPDKDIYGAGFPLGPSGDTYNQGSSIIYSYGGSILKEDGKTSNFNTPQTIAALGVWVDMYNKKAMPPSVVTWDGAGNNKSYLAGQSVMVINAGSIMNVLYKPDNKELLDNTGLYFYPGGPKGKRYKNTGNFMAIFQESKAPEIGEEIIKYVLAYDWYKQWMISISPVAMPVYDKARVDPAWTEDKYNKYFIDQAVGQQQFGYPGYPTGAHGEMQNLRVVSKAFQRNVVDKVPLEQAVAETDKFIQNHLKKLYGK